MDGWAIEVPLLASHRTTSRWPSSAATESGMPPLLSGWMTAVAGQPLHHLELLYPAAACTYLCTSVRGATVIVGEGTPRSSREVNDHVASKPMYGVSYCESVQQAWYKDKSLWIGSPGGRGTCAGLSVGRRRHFTMVVAAVSLSSSYSTHTAVGGSPTNQPPCASRCASSHLGGVPRSDAGCGSVSISMLSGRVRTRHQPGWRGVDPGGWPEECVEGSCVSVRSVAVPTCQQHRRL